MINKNLIKLGEKGKKPVLNLCLHIEPCTEDVQNSLFCLIPMSAAVTDFQVRTTFGFSTAQFCPVGIVTLDIVGQFTCCVFNRQRNQVSGHFSCCLCLYQPLEYLQIGCKDDFCYSSSVQSFHCPYSDSV